MAQKAWVLVRAEIRRLPVYAESTDDWRHRDPEVPVEIDSPPLVGLRQADVDAGVTQA